jgi:hypothetical protein
VIEELGRLPKTLAETHDVFYNQILESGTRSRLIGERVLKWLLAAQWPLDRDELTEAISSDDGGFTTITSKDILNMTCNLVVEDTDLGVFRFAHYRCWNTWKADRNSMLLSSMHCYYRDVLISS